METYNCNSLPKPSLNTLINFVTYESIPQKILYNSLNKEVFAYYLDEVNRKYSKGFFYLGGQIKMTPNEEITLEKIKEAREITKKREIEYGGPCNSLEAHSISKCKRLLNEMEEIIKCYSSFVE